MPLSEAKSLLSCGPKGADPNFAKQPTGRPGNWSPPPSIHIISHDPASDLYAIEKLADEMDSFSPIVGLQQETLFPNCIFLDISGLASLFGSESELAQSILSFCKQRGYLGQIGIGNTLAQAQGAAQFGMQNAECRMNVGSSTYDSAICIPNSEFFFKSLPVVALRLSDWITTTLHQLGIRTVNQLLALPRKDLSARFGKEVHQRIDQMTGKFPEPIIARKPLPEHYAEQLLDHPTSHQETIEIILERLIEKVCRQMASAQQGALQWTIRMYCQNHKLPLKLFVSLFHPTTTATHIVQLARMQLEQLLMQTGNKKPKKQKSRTRLTTSSQIPFEVNEVTISVTSCVLLSQRQRKLFDENPRLDRQSLAHLINRLSGRLGRQNVVYPSLVSGAQPEHAYQMKPLVNPYSRGPRRTVNEKVTRQLSHVMARPIKIFHPPIPLESVEISHNDSQETGRPPALLISAELRRNVINYWGPERIETGWWRGSTARRDYWRVETESHQQFWIYNDLRKRTWFLQGEF